LPRWHDRQIRMHGFGERYAGTQALKMDLPSFMKAFTDETAYAQVRSKFVAQVKPLIEKGAEVIIPAGGLPMLLFARESPFVIDDAPVLNGIAIVVKATEMAISLRSITNLVVSRRGTYAKAPPEAIAEFQERLR
jgi:allantoin racemase